MKDSLSVAVVGAAGFAGAELVRLLLNHPRLRLTTITSDAYAGKSLAALYPAFTGVSDLVFVATDAANLNACDIVFLAVPHKAALGIAPALIEAGVTVIDLSADYRLKDPAVYEHWYNTPHTSVDLLAQAAFGLPELKGDELDEAAARFVRGEAVLVACAGCYPTASSLAAMPALEIGWVDSDFLVIDAISGVSGAGKTATERTHFCNANEDLEAYGVGSHRHTPEIQQILNLSNTPVFTPHLAPLNRGLLATVTMRLRERRCPSAEELHECYSRFYESSSMVTVLPLGQWPKTTSVVGTNYAHIGLGFSADASAIIAVSAIDNLGKGAAGQALQCANRVCGFEEALGLQAQALPV